MENLELQNSELINLEISDSNNKNKKKFLPKKFSFYASLFVLFIFIFYFLFFSAPRNFPVGSNVSIESGESLRSISENLKEKNIIRSRVLFETFVIILGGEKNILVGDYLFENKISVFAVAKKLAFKERNLIKMKVTIPEGFDNLEIANTFVSKLSNFGKDKFLEQANNEQGYLFPDTYFFFSSDNELDVLDYMKSNFDKKIKEVSADIISSDKSQEDIIIMASIIEKEAKGDNDRGIIAGILWNRISKNMPLQVDADLWTYKNKGLPVNPICNPGIEAIKAAIKPTKSSYLYYLHDPDGGIHYAKSFLEHQSNIKKYLK
ncbi:MAG: endolytic transglycosylase MltG [Patescibacteria group bacterium]